MTDQPCLEVPFDEVEKWEKIQGSCARLYAAAEWGYKQALATPPPEPLRPIPVSERLQQMEDLAADAVAGLRYIEQNHGRLYGVGWDRVYEKADRLKPAPAILVIATELENAP